MKTRYLLAQSTVLGVSIVRELGAITDNEAYEILHEAQNSGRYTFPFIISRSKAWKKYPAEMRRLAERNTRPYESADEWQSSRGDDE